MKPNEIHVFDDFLTPTEIGEVQNIIRDKGWSFTGRSGPDSPKRMATSFWYMELADDPFFTIVLVKKIEEHTGKKYVLNRVYANGQTYGLDGEYHIDDNCEESFTFLLYFTPNVTAENVHFFGGYTLLKNDTGAQAIDPIYNRAILFKSNLYHKGLAPSRFSTELRITIAFKLREVVEVLPCSSL